MRPANLLLLVIIPGMLLRQDVAAKNETVRWKGEVRVRGELDGRDFLSQTPANAYTLLRIRFGAEIVPSERITMVMTIQDARVFGAGAVEGFTGTTVNAATIDLYEGFLTINDLFTHGLQVSAGRMGLTFGNERIIGKSEWSNTGRAFDGIRFHYGLSRHSVDLFVTNIGQTTPAPVRTTPASVHSVRDSGQTFSGMYYAYQPSASEQYEGYILHEWNRMKSFRNFVDLSRFTLGAYATGPLDLFSYTGEFAYQFGTIRGVDISAVLAAASLRYAIGDMTIGTGFDYLSGTAEGASGYQSFDPSFHTGHPFYGYMDYFVNIPVDVNSRGLKDLYIDLTSNLLTDVAIGVRIHYFTLAKKWGGQVDLGQEIDVTATWNLDSNVSISGGASAFVPGSLMRTWFGGADAGWWGYLTTHAWL
jgi:hypothetical protein